MTMRVLKSMTVQDMQQDFCARYPFLNIEFYRHSEGRLGAVVRQKVNKSFVLGSLGMKIEGLIRFDDNLTVGELENIFLKQFGLHVQVSQKPRTAKLQTMIAEKWTLSQQNNYGKFCQNQ